MSAYVCENCGPVDQRGVVLYPGAILRHLVPDGPNGQLARECGPVLWGGGPFTGTRESLHARISDVLRRSGVSDAEQLIRAMEQFEAARVAGLDSIRDVLAWSGEWKVGCDCWDRFAEISKRMDAARLSGRSIGPAKPASESP